MRVRLQYLKTSRPTAVNLSEAVARLTAACWALTCLTLQRMGWIAYAEVGRSTSLSPRAMRGACVHPARSPADRESPAARVCVSQAALEVHAGANPSASWRELFAFFIAQAEAMIASDVRPRLHAPPKHRTVWSHHVPQRTANFGNKDRRNRPHAADFLHGSVSSTVPENRSVVS